MTFDEWYETEGKNLFIRHSRDSMRAAWYTALEHTDLVDAIRIFVERVNYRAEANIEKTGKLEGAHCAAMQQELAILTGDKE